MRRLVCLLSLLLPVALAASGRVSADVPLSRDGDDKVVILVFSDYSCPYCDQARPMLSAIESKFGGAVRILYKHYPLGRGDKELLAHEAAEAAAAQGKFQKMHDALFEAGLGRQDRKVVTATAERLGLDMKRFRSFLDGHSGVAAIERDIAEASALKVVATPTFYINGFKLDGLQAQETLERLIEQQLTPAKRVTMHP